MNVIAAACSDSRRFTLRSNPIIRAAQSMVRWRAQRRQAEAEAEEQNRLWWDLRRRRELDRELLSEICRGDIDAVRILLQEGANANACFDMFPYSAISVALVNTPQPNIAMAQELIDHGATPAGMPMGAWIDRGIDDLALLHTIVPADRWVDFLNRQDSRGMTALHHAVAVGQIGTVRYLLTHGADPSMLSNDGVAPRDAGPEAYSAFFKPNPARRQECISAIDPYTDRLALMAVVDDTPAAKPQRRRM